MEGLVSPRNLTGSIPISTGCSEWTHSFVQVWVGAREHWQWLTARGVARGRRLDTCWAKKGEEERTALMTHDYDATKHPTLAAFLLWLACYHSSTRLDYCGLLLAPSSTPSPAASTFANHPASSSSSGIPIRGVRWYRVWC